MLYLDGRADAGLSHSLVLTGIGLVVGILFGAIVTRIYDRRDDRAAPAVPAAAAAAPVEPVTVSAPVAPETAAVTEETYPEP